MSGVPGAAPEPAPERAPGRTPDRPPDRTPDPAADAAACAGIVGRDDPRLHATALFAPPPARARLLVLYAFDVELSRAARASSESLIPRMRLQWWRDVAEAARAGAEPPAHEVAGPLARLIGQGRLPEAPVAALIDAREAELDGLDGGPDAAGFAAWADARFGSLSALAAHLLTDGDAASAGHARRAGPVLAASFALRHAARMAAGGRTLLPGLAPAERDALAHGAFTDGARATARSLAADALAGLEALRRDRRLVDRRATPAFLPLLHAERVLRRASCPGVAPGDLDAVDRPFDGIRLAWRAATGRW